MTSVVLVGASGFVGSALHAALARRTDLVVTPVTRATYDEARQRSFDILINAAMPSGRFWSRQHPQEDFAETVQKTADLLYRWRLGKLVQISTLSARCQPDTVYGRHKAAAERLCAFGENLVVRLGPMYGPTLAKGVLIDMLNHRKVFADRASRYGFAPLAFVAQWIADHLGRVGVVEVGARNALTLGEVADYLGVSVEFEGPLDHQEVEGPTVDFPDARDVLRFLDEVRAGRVPRPSAVG